MATTVDRTVGAAGSAYSASELSKFFVVENIVDTAALNAAAAETAQCIDVRRGSLVMLVGLELMTLEGGQCTVDVGDGSDPDGYLDGINLNTGTVPVFFSSNLAFTISTTNANITMTTITQLYDSILGKFYGTADDTLDVLFNDASDLVKLRLFALVVDCTGRGSLM